MLTISIINYRSRLDTERCIRDLAAACQGLEFRILVRDHSNPPETEALRESLSDLAVSILYFSSPENPGFGAGHNRNFRAVEHRPADALLILNPDVLIPATDTVRKLLAALDPMTMVSPLIRTTKGEVWYAGGRFRRLTGDVVVRRSAFSESQSETDFISGCCMLISAELFAALNGFDEQFFMYAEDMDLCLRARAHGARLIVVDQEIIHKIGSGEKGVYSDLYLYQGTRNRLISLRAHRRGIRVLAVPYFLLWYGVARTLQLLLFSKAPFRQIPLAWRGLCEGLGASPGSASTRGNCRRDLRNS